MEILSSSSIALIGISVGKSERLWALNVSIDRVMPKGEALWRGQLPPPYRTYVGCPTPLPFITSQNWARLDPALEYAEGTG